MDRVYTYTKKEEVVNAITHGIGVGLSIAALVLMITNTVVNGATGRLAIVLIYGISMLMLFTFSTLCHAFPEGKTKMVLELFDHVFCGYLHTLCGNCHRRQDGIYAAGSCMGISLFGHYL